MIPKEPLKPEQYRGHADGQRELTKDKNARKIIERGQNAAQLLRRWLYNGRRDVPGTVLNFPAPLTHEEFIRASHLSFLAHDDAHLKWTKTAIDTANDYPKFAEHPTRSQLRSLIQMDINRHNLPNGVKHLLVESRMLQEDFRNVVVAQETLMRLNKEPKTEETERAIRNAKEVIDEHQTYIKAQHPAVITFNAAQASSYFDLLRAESKRDNFGVIYWPLAAMALYGPYLEKGKGLVL
ncbi:hypothetical protein HY994_01965 [Candidatus Micrarchaeota archaeon]|nr:hypothetical protein [Candidatus Micrarchaeota archaeon]